MSDGSRLSEMERLLRVEQAAGEAATVVHHLPGRGLATQWAGRRGDSESVERAYQLDDGSAWRSTLIEKDTVFLLEVISPGSGSGSGVEHAWSEAPSGCSRKVRVDGSGRITRLFGVGAWGRLPALIEAALDGTPVTAESFASFAATGALYLEMPARDLPSMSGVLDPLVCFCMQVSRRTLRREIRAGSSTFEELRRKTGCSTVCGGCQPSVRDLLGRSEWTAVTARAIPVRGDLRCFRLYPRGGVVPEFSAGQHVIIEGFVGGRWVGRPYTITSPPHEAAYLELCVRREPQGLLSSWLFSGNLDEKSLHISAPRGDFRWQPGGRPAVCFVAGIGITPALAMVRTARASSEPGRVHVDYSAHDAPQLSFLDELTSAARARESITVRPRNTCVEGRITTAEVQATARQFPDADFYLCGPGPYMAMVREALVAAGVSAARVKVEVFVPAVRPAAAASPEATVPSRPRPLRIVVGLGAMVVMVLGAWLAIHLYGP